MDDWDNIDWDEKVEEIIKTQQQEEQTQEASSSTVQVTFFAEDDGNYFEANQEKKRRQQEAREHNNARSSKGSKQNDNFIQPYSNKDLRRVREYARSSSSFHHLIYETFGQFERFLMTHQTDLTHDAIVELLIIDSCLLEVPFHSHNQLLLKEISKINSFWSQLISFIQEFLSSKHQDMKFLLTVDMNGFFDNIESLLENLLARNLFDEKMKKVFEEIVEVMENFEGNKWSCGGRLKRIFQDRFEISREQFNLESVRKF